MRGGNFRTRARAHSHPLTRPSTHPHTHTHTHTHTYALTHARARAPTHIHTRTYTLSVCLSVCQSLSLSLSLSFSLSLSKDDFYYRQHINKPKPSSITQTLRDVQGLICHGDIVEGPVDPLLLGNTQALPGRVEGIDSWEPHLMELLDTQHGQDSDSVQNMTCVVL